MLGYIRISTQPKHLNLFKQPKYALELKSTNLKSFVNCKNTFLPACQPDHNNQPTTLWPLFFPGQSLFSST